MLVKHCFMKDALYKLHGLAPIFGPSADIILSLAKASTAIRQMCQKYRKCKRDNNAKLQVCPEKSLACNKDPLSDS